MNKLCTSLDFFALVLTGFGLLDSIEYEYLDQIERVAFYDQFRGKYHTFELEVEYFFLFIKSFILFEHFLRSFFVMSPVRRTFLPTLR